MTEMEQRSLILRQRYDLTVPERALIERGLLLAEFLGKKEYTCPILGAKFILIPAGTFMMGSNENNKNDNEHQVTISKSFYMQTTPVTQGQWQRVMGSNPSYFKGDDNLPVEKVSWNDVQDFIGRLNRQGGMVKYRLPTEAEWEYACRAGSTTAYCFGDDPGGLGEYAWHKDNSGDGTHPVRQKKPNAWGLYDMHGNVWEWVRDLYEHHTSASVTDPEGPPSGWGRVIRGGSWDYHARLCRSSVRLLSDPGGGGNINLTGFRLLYISSHREIKSEVVVEKRSEKFKKLISLGEEKGFLTYDDVHDLFPSDIISSDQIDDIIMLFGEKNIDIIDTDKGEKLIASKMNKPAITTPKAIKGRIRVGEAVTIGDLAKKMGVKASEVINKLMGLGLMVTINQSIDCEAATLIATEFGYQVEPEGDFITYDNGTVLDTRTNLMWAARDNEFGINWADAESYCENYRGGGYSDWRMPTLGELEALYENGNYKNVIQITGWLVWASETRGSGSAYFDFSDGSRSWSPPSASFDSRALPVRPGKDGWN